MTSDRAALDRPLRTGGRSRGAALWAVSALLVASAVSCGSDSGDDDPTASDPTSSSTSSSPSDSASTSASPTESGSATESGDPVPSPVIDEAVKGALEDGFPALVPAGVPDGWTVVSASYSPGRGGIWRVALTDPNGAAVQLLQLKAGVDALVRQALGGAAKPSGEVDLGEYGTGTWTVYSGDTGTAIAKRLSGTSAVVVGMDQDTVVTLADQLLTAEDSGNGSGDG
jgi:hypothetical protein